MELTEIISELRSHVARATRRNKGLLLMAINSLEAINRDPPAPRAYPYPKYTEEPNMNCSECQPGRHCYGHGHY